MENRYAVEIETRLNITRQITMCNNLFNEFIQNKKVDISSEINFLTEIKRFLVLEEKNIKNINMNSKIRNYDCLTLAIIACLVSSRNSFCIKIGMPDKVSRYYHHVLITSDNTMFKLTGKKRNYGFKELPVNTIVQRLAIFNPIMDFFHFISSRNI